MSSASASRASKRGRSATLVASGGNTRLTPKVAQLALKTPTGEQHLPSPFASAALGHLRDDQDELESPRKKERRESPPLARPSTSRKSVLEKLGSASDKFTRPPSLVIENPAHMPAPASASSNQVAAPFQEPESESSREPVVTPSTTTHRTSLHAAIVHGDVAAVKRLLGES